MTQPPKPPVIIDIDTDTPPPDVGTAPPIDGAAMQMAVDRMARPASGWAKLFWSALGGFALLVLGLAAWDYVHALLARQPALGWVAAGLLGLALLGLLAGAWREWLGWRRLSRLDGLRTSAAEARRRADRRAALDVTRNLGRIYGGAVDGIDADTLLDTAEGQWLLPLDTRVRAEIDATARQVALATAMLPVALADVAAALFLNLRMIRRIAEIYGGRAGTFGSFRLARMVAAHLLATGAMAVGDDLLGSVAGGGLAAKVSRRFGEGVVNGALTARVGIAAMDVCRPMPFVLGQRPSVSGVMGRALKGAFDRG